MNFHEERVSDEVKRLIAERDALRNTGRWMEADAVRQKLIEMGIEISDTAEGTIWRLR